MWAPGWDAPLYGLWTLPGEPGEVGRKCVTLHRHLADLHALEPLTRIGFEGGIAPSTLQGFTNVTTINLLVGLASHVESFGFAVSARVRQVPISAWRKHALGKGSGYKRAEWKKMSMARAREMGWAPQTDDVADSLMVLDYLVYLSALTPPWRDATVLRREIA